jgi:hypothetical protein
MHISIYSTEKITRLDGVECRVWEGVTADGTSCIVFVHRVAVNVEANAAAFDRELKEQLQPGQFIDLRHVL